MYDIQLKRGMYQYTPFKRTPELDLNHWMFDLLVRFGKTPVKDSCGISNLYIKRGFYKRTKKPSGNLFNLEKYFIKVLKEYSVITQIQIDADNCDTRSQLYIPLNYIYFSDEIQNKNASLLTWLEDLLTDCQVTFTIP